MTALLVALAIAAITLAVMVGLKLAARLKAAGHVVAAEGLVVTLHCAEKLGHGESLAQAIREEAMSDEARDFLEDARTYVAARIASRSKIGLVFGMICFGLAAGCSASMPNVTPDDLDRLTRDLAAVHSAVTAIDSGNLPDKEARALEDVKAGMGKAVTVSDILARVARGAQSQ